MVWEDTNKKERKSRKGERDVFQHLHTITHAWASFSARARIKGTIVWVQEQKQRGATEDQALHIPKCSNAASENACLKNGKMSC